MNNKYISIFLLIILLTLTTIAPGKQEQVLTNQNKQETISISQGCLDVFGNKPADIDKVVFESLAFVNTPAEAEAALTQILLYTGLQKNFVIMPYNVPNAVATISSDGRRYILYNPEFMKHVGTTIKTGTDWASLSILAHEIGHHLQGHTLLAGGSRPGSEIEADDFSGFILYQMGASLLHAQAAMNKFGNESDTPTHPGKQKRLDAIKNGWNRAFNLSIDRNAKAIIDKFAGSRIALKSIKNGKYVQARFNLELPEGEYGGLVAKADKIGLWETFVLERVGNNQVALKSIKNGKYVQARFNLELPEGEYGGLVAKADKIGSWETFVLERVGDNQVALKSVINGKYVQARFNLELPSDKFGSLMPAAPNVFIWEIFILESVPN